eukprot:7114119-Prymnesium_polylepis.1
MQHAHEPAGAVALQREPFLCRRHLRLLCRHHVWVAELPLLLRSLVDERSALGGEGGTHIRQLAALPDGCCECLRPVGPPRDADEAGVAVAPLQLQPLQLRKPPRLRGFRMLPSHRRHEGRRSGHRVRQLRVAGGLRRQLLRAARRHCELHAAGSGRQLR